MAAGTYKPDCNSADPNGSGDKEATFGLINNVAIYGGFPPGGGLWESRNPNDPNNETILSGDLKENDRQGLDPYDLLNDPCRADNSYHVVTGSGTDGTAVLDGFTITDGNNFGSGGGGMYNESGSPTVRNCRFSENSVLNRGGGMYNDSGSPTVKNCMFSGNLAGLGGGVYNDTGSLTVTDCNFSGNLVYEGGGINNQSGSLTITGCTFSGNMTNNDPGAVGGGIYSNGDAIIADCTFIRNLAFIGGGIGSNSIVGPIIITNCIFTENSATISGGGVWNSNTGPIMITNCTFSGNLAQDQSGGGMHNNGNSTITNCIFSGNRAYGGNSNQGGGMYNEGSAKITNCMFSGNSAYGMSESSGGGIHNWGHATIVNCTFTGNSARGCYIGDPCVIGNWEGQMDGWALWPGPDPNAAPPGTTTEYNDITGVTRDGNSLKLTVPEGGWRAILYLQLDYDPNDPNSDPNLAGVFFDNNTFSIDVTRLAVEWQPPGEFSRIHMIVNASSDTNESVWEDLGVRVRWSPGDGDQPWTASWDYTAAKKQIDPNSIDYLEFILVTDFDDANYPQGIYYLDNARLRTFVGSGHGGGICGVEAETYIDNCVLYNNTASTGNEIAALNLVEVSYSDVKGGQAAVYNPYGNLVCGGQAILMLTHVLSSLDIGTPMVHRATAMMTSGLTATIACCRIRPASMTAIIVPSLLTMRTSTVMVTQPSRRQWTSMASRDL